MINWKVRFMNKTWVVAFIAALFILIGAIAKLFGYEIDTTNIQENIVNVVYAVFGVLAVLGVVVDGTTVGFSDSQRALEYETLGGALPKADEIEDEDSETKENDEIEE